MKHPDLLRLDPRLIRCLQQRPQQLRLRDQILNLRRFDVVAQLIFRIRWVRAREDAACSIDTHDEDWIVDVVERVDADTVATLEAMVVEAGDEFPYEFPCLVPGDVARGVKSVDQDWSVGVEGAGVEDPGCEVFGREGDVLGGWEGHRGLTDFCSDNVFCGKD